jgi:hypothetical protein
MQVEFKKQVQAFDKDPHQHGHPGERKGANAAYQAQVAKVRQLPTSCWPTPDDAGIRASLQQFQTLALVARRGVPGGLRLVHRLGPHQR